jgi:hypothetical protein
MRSVDTPLRKVPYKLLSCLPSSICCINPRVVSCPRPMGVPALRSVFFACSADLRSFSSFCATNGQRLFYQRSRNREAHLFGIKTFLTSR